MLHPGVGKLKYMWFTGLVFELKINALIEKAQWELNRRIMVGTNYV